MQSISTKRAIILPSNQPPDRTSRGGDKISQYRGEPEKGPYTPEDWIASTTCCHGDASLGLTKLANGNFLIDEIKSNPEAWLGVDHLSKFGVDSKLLVKLLHAGQRGPVHAHPSDAFAREFSLGLNGKAEAWHILEPGEVFLGLKRDVTHDELRVLIETQDVETLLGLLHRVQVKAHQTVYVPAGLLHSIGKGVFLLEVQQPADLSVILEWRDLAIDGNIHGHLGIGFDAALGAVEICGRSEKEISALTTGEDQLGYTLPSEAHQFFRFERVQVDHEYQSPACFSILVVLSGELVITSSDESNLNIAKGHTILLPFAAGPTLLRGSGEVMFIRPPPTT
ncbi:hypothetical protein IFR05_012095 [Cadophora sp. M221]|nr:hypothetical protein IFR05_012095 [Cadophora sp. M221]